MPPPTAVSYTPLAAADEASVVGDSPGSELPPLHRGWEDLNEKQRRAATRLGWSRSSWEQGDASVFDVTGGWSSLTPGQRRAATTLRLDQNDFGKTFVVEGDVGRLGIAWRLENGLGRSKSVWDEPSFLQIAKIHPNTAAAQIAGLEPGMRLVNLQRLSAHAHSAEDVKERLMPIMKERPLTMFFVKPFAEPPPALPGPNKTRRRARVDTATPTVPSRLIDSSGGQSRVDIPQPVARDDLESGGGGGAGAGSTAGEDSAQMIVGTGFIASFCLHEPLLRRRNRNVASRWPP
eukprot:COSAG05_NODE_5143_length_1253_cov_87.784229_1_plen_290_part_10